MNGEDMGGDVVAGLLEVVMSREAWKRAAF